MRRAVIKLDSNLDPPGYVVRLVEGDRAILDALYGCESASAPLADLVVPFDQFTPEAFRAYVLEVARDARLDGVRLQVAENGDGTIAVEADDPPPPAEELRVDLKWSLWSADESFWEERAPGSWARMKAAFAGTAPPVVVLTAPRKEIRSGRVSIAQGGGRGIFATEWDEPQDLADLLGIDDEDETAVAGLRDILPYSAYLMEPGVERNFDIDAVSFEELMKRIDTEEEALLAEDQACWDDLKAGYLTKGEEE